MTAGDPLLAHVAAHLGPPEAVIRDPEPGAVTVDVYVVPPADSRPCISLVTRGASDHPMAVPDDAHGSPFAEFVVHLPSAWPLDADSLRDPRYGWPLHCLRAVARLPHAQAGWVALGHTFPNGDPPRPYAADTQLCCVMLEVALIGGPAFGLLELNGRRVEFLTLIPLTAPELDFKLREGREALENLFDRHQVGPWVDPHRPGVVP